MYVDTMLRFYLRCRLEACFSQKKKPNHEVTNAFLRFILELGSIEYRKLDPRMIYFIFSFVSKLLSMTYTIELLMILMMHDNIIDLLFDALRMCFLGNRLLREKFSGNCTKEEGSILWNTFCSLNNRTLVYECDPYFDAHNTSFVRGVRGLKSGAFFGKILQ